MNYSVMITERDIICLEEDPEEEEECLQFFHYRLQLIKMK